MWQQFLSSLASGAGSGLAGGIMGKIFGSGKQQIPSGYAMGKRQADYFQALYKGQLNPWELAGAGGQGEGGAAAPLMAGLQQRKSQDSNLKNMLALESAKIAKDVQVAQIQADAHVKAAGTQPDSKTNLDDAQRAKYNAEWNRIQILLRQEEKLLKSDVKLRNQQYLTEIKNTLKTGSQADIEKIISEYQEYREWANLGDKGTRALMNLLGAGAAGRFMQKGFGGLSGNGPRGGPGGYFGHKGVQFGGPGPFTKSPSSSSAPRFGPKKKGEWVNSSPRKTRPSERRKKDLYGSGHKYDRRNSRHKYKDPYNKALKMMNDYRNKYRNN